jgi:hypothetical protein
MVAWSTQATAGPTGTLTATLSSGVNGIGWSAVIAVAPR